MRRESPVNNGLWKIVGRRNKAMHFAPKEFALK